MTLIKSISGIRGTIGGSIGDNLTPLDILKFTAAYAQWLQQRNPKVKNKVAVGRDARISGEMVENLVIGTLLGCGIDVINLGLATTPTVEMAVIQANTNGGIIITASHNPKQWNALKLLNEKGEFLSHDDGQQILQLASTANFNFAPVENLGFVEERYSFVDEHIKKILELKYVDTQAISKANFTVAIDCVNSVGGIALPRLLKSLGVNKIVEINTTPTGQFAHNPEPLPQHLTDLADTVRREKANVGFAVDPDVDRLAIVNQDGTMFGEEYTLVACANYVLGFGCGNTVSNLSSTKALSDITLHHGGNYHAAAVGEVNVVQKMKEVKAIIGGEGNGGVILPEIHYGRDALVGIALFLSLLARYGKTCSELRQTLPNYFITKNRLELPPNVNPDTILNKMKDLHQNEKINTTDGLRIDLDDGWVHMRKSNTEPIIRIYAESSNKQKAEQLANSMMEKIKKII